MLMARLRCANKRKWISSIRNENKSLFLCADMQDNCCTQNAMLYDAEKAQKCLTCFEKYENQKRLIKRNLKRS